MPGNILFSFYMYLVTQCATWIQQCKQQVPPLPHACACHKSYLSLADRVVAHQLHTLLLGAFKVATYFIIIFYLMGFYCQIKISDLIGVFKVTIYSYLLVYLL